MSQEEKRSVFYLFFGDFFFLICNHLVELMKSGEDAGIFPLYYSLKHYPGIYSACVVYHELHPSSTIYMCST